MFGYPDNFDFRSERRSDPSNNLSTFPCLDFRIISDHFRVFFVIEVIPSDMRKDFIVVAAGKAGE